MEKLYSCVKFHLLKKTFGLSLGQLIGLLSKLLCTYFGNTPANVQYFVKQVREHFCFQSNGHTMLIVTYLAYNNDWKID